MNARRLLLGGALVAALAVAPAPATSIMETPAGLAELHSGTDEGLILARHRLPHGGVDVLPEVLLAIRDADPRIARTAELVARDIAAESTAPGRDADRREATAVIEQFLRMASTDREKLAGLRLLSRTAPEGWSVDAVVALLDDPNPGIQSRALDALEELGTEPARAALRALLASPDEARRIAAARSLGVLSDGESREPLLAMLSGGSPAEKAHAARALAEILDPIEMPALLGAWREAGDEHRAIAASAVLRLAQRDEEVSAFDVDFAAHTREAYRALLASPVEGEVVAAAAALGRVGEAGDASLLVATARDGSPAARLAALAALGDIRAPDATPLLLDAYEAIRVDERPFALRALGQRADDRAAGLLQREAASPDAATRREAIVALGAIPSARAIEALRPSTLSDDAAVAAAARESLLQVAQALAARGDSAAAAEASLAVAGSPGATTGEKRRALSGLMAAPGLGGLDMVLKLSEDESLAPEAIALLVQLSATAAAAGDGDRATLARDRAFALDDSRATRIAYAEAMRARGLAVDDAALLGPVARWRVIGPFPVGNVMEEWDKQFLDPASVDATAAIEHEGESLDWRALEGALPLAHIDLIGPLGQVGNAFAYAHAEIVSPTRQLGQLRLGSDDGVTVWLNGAKIHDNKVDRGVAPDSDIVRVRLEEGRNTILLRISQGGGGWGFALRVTDLQGNGLDLEEVTP